MSSPKAPRNTRRKEDRPAQLLEAALELFAQKGYSATRAEEIAKRAGVSKGTLFLYFNSKEELFEAMVRQAIIPVVKDAQSFAQAHNGSAADLLRALTHLWWERNGHTTARSIPFLIVAEAHHFPECVRYFNQAVVDPCHELVRQVVERGIASGEFRADLNPQLVWLSFHGLLSYPSFWDKAVMDNPGHSALHIPDLSDFVHAHCELLIRGLLAQPAQEKA